MVWPALIAAGATLAGTYFATKKSEKAAKAANAVQQQTADKNIELQKEFAQSGIQWKTEDAKKAGIHPLYAMGAQTHTFNPVSVGSAVPDYSPIAAAGQDIGRAINASRSPGAKIDAYNKTVQDLSVTRMGLENELLAAQISKVRQGSQSAGIPSDNTQYLITGQGDAVTSTPLEEEFKRSPSRPLAPAAEYATIPDVGYARTHDGGYAITKSKDMQERLEDDWVGSAAWQLRNRWAPSIHSHKMNPPPDIPLRANEYWIYNPVTGVYYKRISDHVVYDRNRKVPYGFPR